MSHEEAVNWQRVAEDLQWERSSGHRVFVGLGFRV